MLPPLFVNTFSRFSRVWDMGAQSALSIGSAGWLANNLAVYVPLSLPWSYPIKRFLVWNGGTASGNIDIGLYSRDGAKLVTTGSTVQAGTSTAQYIAASYLASPGSYYLALALSSSGGTVQRNAPVIGATILRQYGLLQESVFPLPNTMTPVAYTVSGYPLFGFTLTESGF